MKKIILYIIAFSMLYAVTEATTSDCFTGDCTGEKSQWQPSGITPLVVNTNSCSFLIDYKWRICDGPPIRRELEITGIREISGCDGVSISYVMNLAIRQALWESNAIFGVPDPGANEYDVYIGTKPCWYRSNQIPPWIYHPCPEPPQRACCITRYTMRIINDSMVTLAQNIIQQNFNCQNPGLYDCGDNICNTHNMNLGTSPVPRITACPCDWNVAWSNYVQYSSGTVTVNNENCRFKVYYHLRYCQSAVEFYPYRVELLDNCQSFGINAIFESAIRVIIRDVGLRYGGNQDLRRRMPACWRRIDNILIPCEMENCCVKFYDISLYQLNKIFILNANMFDEIIECTTCSLFCRDDIQGGDILERSSTYEESEFLSDSKTQLTIIPNPAEDKIRIIFDSSRKNGLMVINIFDGMGKLVHKSSYVKNFEPFYNEINITKLSNGMYRYVVELDGMIYSTGSFIKLK